MSDPGKETRSDFILDSETNRLSRLTWKWEKIAQLQGDLLAEQGKIIGLLIEQRDEAQRSLRTGSDQWELWRKDAMP